MNSRPRARLLFLIWLGGALAVPAAAQDGAVLQGTDRSGVLEPKDFGIQDEGITVVNFTAFLPWYSSTGYGSDALERWTTTALGAYLFAPVTGIPDGATLTQVTFYFRDDSATDELEVALYRNWVDSATGQNAAFDVPVTLTSSGSPGEAQLNEFTNLPIRYRFDVDGDGTQEVVSYYLVSTTNAGDPTVAIRGARLRWRRNVSPAPANATFNDVPTSDGAFQFIEALVASGITVGCGGGNYCPDAPLTRRQMAVFLSKALGLHWAWNFP